MIGFIDCTLLEQFFCIDEIKTLTKREQNIEYFKTWRNEVTKLEVILISSFVF